MRLQKNGVIGAERELFCRSNESDQQEERAKGARTDGRALAPLYPTSASNHGRCLGEVLWLDLERN